MSPIASSHTTRPSPAASCRRRRRERRRPTEIVTGAGTGGGPHVKAFSGLDGSTIDSLLAYQPGFTGGVRVGVADLNGDGRYEIRVASGPGRPAEVRTFDGTTGGPLGSFVPFGGPITGTYIGGERAS